MRSMKIAAVAVMSLFLSLTVAGAESITIITGEWAPYMSEKLPGGGPVNELVQAAFKAAGVEAKFKYVPWKRALQAIKTGKTVASSSWTFSEDRKVYAAASEPLMEQGEVFIFMKDRLPGFDYTGLAGLKKHKVAALSGYRHESLFKDAGLNPDVSKDTETAVKKLYGGRVDLMCEDRVVALTTIRRLYPGQEDKFGFSKTPRSVDFLHLLFSRKHPEMGKYLEKFNAGLSRIKEDGTYQAIMDKMN